MDDIIHGEFADERRAVEQRLHDVLDAATSKDFDRLISYHLDSPKFTKFNDAGPRQRIGIDENDRTERAELEALDTFDATLDDLRVDVFGDVAIATTVLVYDYESGPETGTGTTRMTLVLVNDDGDWKIAHEHLSLFVDDREAGSQAS